MSATGRSRRAVSERVIWHDLECGDYRADLGLWGELAAGADGPVLDVGAGTGRVTLDLARRGHEVIALDRDRELLDVLRERAEGLPVRCVVADARELALPEPVGLCLVPMQTIQLLPGRADRSAFLRRARAHLRPGALLACALADALEGVGQGWTTLPRPDRAALGGSFYESQPVAVREEPEAVVIERIRTTLRPGGRRSAEGDRVRLARLDAAALAAEGEQAGLHALAPRHIAATRDHVGSEVAILRA